MDIIIMKSSSPSTAKREKWMHRMAEEGMKVMICNPSLVETGLDFCWVDKKGEMYNYPTITYKVLAPCGICLEPNYTFN